MSQPSPTVPSSPYKIFISYRRSDSQATVDHIFEWLVRAFGREVIFKDVDAIPRGYEFAPYIKHVLSQCRVALLALGPSWPTVLATEGAYSGRPRLDDPEDHVRIETEQALTLAPVDATGAPASALLLIPVLVQGAQMPRPEDLSASLRPLCGRNGTPVRYDPDFTRDMQRLISDCAHWMGVPVPDLLGGGIHTPASLRPPDEADEFLAVAVPQIRDAFSAQNWAQVIRQAKALPLQVSSDRVPTEVYQMWGRALMAMRDYAGAKIAWDTVRRREPRDVAALQAAAEARVELNEREEALALLDGALMLTQGHAQQQVALLAMYAHTLRDLAQSEPGDAAQTHWADLLRVANEGRPLAGTKDGAWLMMKLEALQGLGREVEALAIARTLTARSDATTAQWVARARLAWKMADEMPTDEARAALDAASRLAPNDASIATARYQLLFILPPDRFPPRLAELGFTANKRGGVAFIVPPVCAVPAGEFLMGSDPRRDKEARPDEQPQHRVNLAAYSIARFPVTVAEYACFVEAGQRPPGQWPQQMQKLDHPVVYVSWDDAVAYAAWLARTTGQPWRLPTEDEWEKAARWDARTGVARPYPWGDSFDQSRANTRESGRGSTTAVGSYPNGASPYGAEEMAGNVWEWVHSLFKPYPYTMSDGREAENSTENRVLRGGSWDGNQRFARAAYRSYYRSDDLYLGLGFRLALPGS